MIFVFHSVELPKFQATDNGVNELDLKIQETRSDELLCLKEEALNLREHATDAQEALDTIDGYLKRVEGLCEEPQNSMPDVVIWMIAGSKRIAYYRIPAYELLYSENPNAKGRMCAQLQNFIMKVRTILHQTVCIFSAVKQISFLFFISLYLHLFPGIFPQIEHNGFPPEIDIFCHLKYNINKIRNNIITEDFVLN